MCLKFKCDRKTRIEKLKDVGREGVKVYKVVADSISYQEYSAPYQWIKYHNGINHASCHKLHLSNIGLTGTYQSGFHFFLRRKDAEGLKRYFELSQSSTRRMTRIIECIVKKSWITDIGFEVAYDDNGYIDIQNATEVIVAKKAIFPDYPNAEVKEK